MLKCNEEAFEKCPTRHLCGSRNEAVFSEGSDCDKFNRQIMNQPKTNADRIRAMSDEELAKWLNSSGGGLFCLNKKECMEMVNTNQDIPEEKCLECLMDWLQQPVEGGL